MPFCVELQYPDEKTSSVTNLRVSDTCLARVITDVAILYKTTNKKKRKLSKPIY